MEDPTTKNEILSIEVSSDKMSATMTLRAGDSDNKKLTISQVLDELKKLGVSHGIEQEAIEAAVEFYRDYGEEDEVVVAQGLPPKHGKAGKVECLVKETKGVSPIKEDGTVDYHEVDRKTTIKKGEPVYQLYPPEKGAKGKDIFGAEIKPHWYDAVKFPPIEHTEIDKNNPNLLISLVDGSVIFLKDGIKLSKLYTVHGDVDFSVGNITFDGPVQVNGDVKSGFKIESSSDVDVTGTVEDALIKAEGAVSVKGGFVGTGKGQIVSNSDVSIGFARNQTVKAKGNIYIKKEALDCTLIAKNKIFVTGHGLGIAGGRAFAIEGMELSCLGSESEVATEIQVGSDPKVKEMIDAIDRQVDVLKKESLYLDKKMQEIELTKRKSKKLFESLIEKMEKVMEEKTKKEFAIERLLKQKKAAITSENYCTNPTIKVNGDIFPGIVLSFHHFKRPIKQQMKRKMFFLDKGEIKESVLVAEK